MVRNSFVQYEKGEGSHKIEGTNPVKGHKEE